MCHGLVCNLRYMLSGPPAANLQVRHRYPAEVDEHDPLVIAIERLVVAGGYLTTRAINAAAPDEAELTVAQYRVLVHLVRTADGLGELARSPGLEAPRARPLHGWSSGSSRPASSGSPVAQAGDRRAVVALATARLTALAAITVQRRAMIAAALRSVASPTELAHGVDIVAAALDAAILAEG